MKNWKKKISVSLVLAVCELLLGILLLANPTGLTSAVIILLGILLILAGAFQLFQYVKLPREEATQTWKLASGTGLLALGIAAIANQHWLVKLLGTLTALYGSIALAWTFMKLQIAVDALRGGRRYWYLMAVSFVCTGALATLLYIQPFAESFIWTFTGVVLIILAVLDCAYLFLGHKSKNAEA